MKTVHYHFDLVSSTNDVGKIFLSSLTSASMAIISADEQSRGRGQFGRTWVSPKGLNLLCSFCFLLEEAMACPPTLTHLLALSTIHILKEKTKLHCAIKLPNDIYFEGKKLGGILCESSSSQHVQFVSIVLGLGLNVNMPSSIIANLNQPATSLLVETKKEWSAREILTDLQHHFVESLTLYRQKGFQSFHEQFKYLTIQKSRDAQ